MPITLTDGLAVLTAVVTVEDAEPLAQWARRTPSPVVDLSECTHLHTAALQVLLAARPVISAAPGDPFLARWIHPLLAVPGTSGTSEQETA